MDLNVDWCTRTETPGKCFKVATQCMAHALNIDINVTWFMSSNVYFYRTISCLSDRYYSKHHYYHFN